MSEQTKKVEDIEQPARASQLTDQDLDHVAGGRSDSHIQRIDITHGQKPRPQTV